MRSKNYQPPCTQQIQQQQYPHLHCLYPIDNMTQLEVTNHGISFIIKYLYVKDQCKLASDWQFKSECNQGRLFENWNQLYLQNLCRLRSLKSDITKNKNYASDKIVRECVDTANTNLFSLSPLPLIKQQKSINKSTYEIYCPACDKKYKKMYPFSYQNIAQFHESLGEKDLSNLFKSILVKITKIFQQLPPCANKKQKKRNVDYNAYVLQCSCYNLFPIIMSSDGLNPEYADSNNVGCEYWQVVYQIIRKFSQQPTPLQKQIQILIQKMNKQKLKNLNDKQFLSLIRKLIQQMGEAYSEQKKYMQNIKYTQQTHNTKQQDNSATNTEKTIYQPIKQDLHIKMVLSSDRNYNQNPDLSRNVKKVNKNSTNGRKIRQYLSQRIPSPVFTNNFSLSNFVLQHKSSINQPDGPYFSINSVSYRPNQQKKQKRISSTEQKVKKKKTSRNSIDNTEKQIKNSLRLSSSPIKGIKQIRNKIKKYNSKFLHQQKQNKKVISSSIRKSQMTKTKQKNMIYSETIPWQQISQVSKFINDKYIKKQSTSEYTYTQSSQNIIKKDDRITRDSITNIQKNKMGENIDQQIKKQQENTIAKQNQNNQDDECMKVLIMIEQQVLKRIDPIGQNINQIWQLGKKYKMRGILQIYLLYKKFFYMRTALLENLTNGQEYGYTSQEWASIKQNKNIGQKIKEIESQNKQILGTLQKMHKKVQKQLQQNSNYHQVDPSIIKIQIQNQLAYEQFIYQMLQQNISRFINMYQIVGNQNTSDEGQRQIVSKYGISIILASVDQLSNENYQQQILTWLASYYQKVCTNDKGSLAQIHQILSKLKQMYEISD